MTWSSPSSLLITRRERSRSYASLHWTPMITSTLFCFQFKFTCFISYHADSIKASLPPLWIVSTAAEIMRKDLQREASAAEFKPDTFMEACKLNMKTDICTKQYNSGFNELICPGGGCVQFKAGYCCLFLLSRFIAAVCSQKEPKHLFFSKANAD